MRKTGTIFAISLAIIVSGCSLAPLIRTDIVDYNESVTEASDRLLIINILRARDHAPLLFSAVQLVHGSLQMGGQTSLSLPFGNGRLKTPNTSGIQLSAQVAPTFDVSSLNTQEFTRGILQPIDPAVVKYFLDRGDIDPKIILLLFFAEIRSAGGDVIRIDPEQPIDIRKALKALATGQIRGTSNIVANAYTELTPVGGEYSGKEIASLKDVASIDQSKYRLLHDADEKEKFKLYAVSPAPKIAFCLHVVSGGSTHFVPLGDIFSDESVTAHVDDPRCTSDEVRVDRERERDRAAGSAHRRYEKVITRSVEGMIQFLGGVLRYEQQNGGAAVTFDHFIRTTEEGEPTPEAFGTNTKDIFFDLSSDDTNAMFGVSYRGDRYNAHRTSGAAGVTDHTLEVLALVSKLLDMNKSAKELPVTQSVQIVP
jgi:hypothetical protein